ncbi:hypothetical protein HPP92_020575 [Vanilla planifolia]|uniref:Uncharacterized protein n=1 Tax=Vanilla planifolia TaxID=51239 RepID=A0A835Q5G3_VANPL|nr:hypothetical protein HPP92_020575 [Vanilla planifolia]
MTTTESEFDYFSTIKICFVEMRMKRSQDERGAMLTKEYVEMRVLIVVDPPKLGLYGMGFGWTMPTKVELVSFVKTRAFLLADNREVDDGIEVGMTL